MDCHESKMRESCFYCGVELLDGFEPVDERAHLCGEARWRWGFEVHALSTDRS